MTASLMGFLSGDDASPRPMRRNREPCGSRRMQAVITTKGRAALENAVPSHAREVQRLFTSRLTPNELDQFADMAATILNHLQADQPPA